jgi:hypothetical protein
MFNFHLLVIAQYYAWKSSLGFLARKMLAVTSSIGEVWEFVAVSAQPMHILKNGIFDGTTKPASRLRA